MDFIELGLYQYCNLLLGYKTCLKKLFWGRLRKGLDRVKSKIEHHKLLSTAFLALA